jgi:hypothetical protein
VRQMLSTGAPERSKLRSILLLATPALAPLLGTQDFARELLKTLYSEHQSELESIHVNLISAVVDALPKPVSAPGADKPSLGSSEGLAVLLSSGLERHTALRSSPDSPDRGSAQSSMPTLTFSVSEQPNILAQKGSSSRQYHVTLPVANTIFVNGQRATLHRDEWNVHVDKMGATGIEFLQRDNLASFRLELPQRPADLIRGGWAPLRPLTKPRKIVNSMGNVLAQIEVDGEAIPASQELEKAVAVYIKSNPNSTAGGPLRVYALVRPNAMVSESSSTGNEQVQAPDKVLDALWRGGKLFKISGGGGGWGKRQGLLSFEAAVDFGTPDAQTTVGFPDFDKDDNFVADFGSRGIIADPSTVEFLVQYSAENASTMPGLVSHHGEHSDLNDTTLTLGAAADPDKDEQVMKDPTATRTGIQFSPRHFGMISYGGAALGCMSREPGTGHLPSTQAQSRLDVPDSRFVIRGLQSAHA